MLSTEKINSSSQWISVFEPLPNERQALINKYEVTQEMLGYAIDPYEKARVEVDPAAGVTLLIFDVYVPTHSQASAQTAPIGIMLTRNNLITFTNAQTNFVNGLIAKELSLLQHNGNISDRFNLVFPVLYQLSTAYFGPLRKADQQRQQLQESLGKHTARKAITEMTEIETGLVYILTSLKGNVSLLEELKRRYPDLSTKQQNDLDDVIVEAQQGLEMAQMTSDVSERVSNAYTKVLDSNLNETMKFLTVYSIVLSIPTIVSGFYGENVKSLPFANSAFAWQITVLIALILMGVCLWIMFNKRWWH